MEREGERRRDKGCRKGLRWQKGLKSCIGNEKEGEDIGKEGGDCTVVFFNDNVGDEVG